MRILRKMGKAVREPLRKAGPGASDNANPWDKEHMSVQEENTLLFMLVARSWEYLTGHPDVTLEEIKGRIREALEYYGRNPSEDEISYERMEVQNIRRQHRESVKKIRSRPKAGLYEMIYTDVIGYFKKSRTKSALTAEEIAGKLSRKGYKFHRKASTMITEAIRKHGGDKHFNVGKRISNGTWRNTYAYRPNLTRKRSRGR